MAKIALSAAATGLMIVAPFTGPAAPFLEAAAVAMAVGAALIPPKIPGMAPQQDLQVSSSADGAPIPFGYGRGRFAGQVIWSPGIVYRPVHGPTGSGKGGGTITSYTYFASFAVAFGEGPATIGRVWGDSKLIYKGGQPFGQVTAWNSTTAYNQDDLVSYSVPTPGSGPGFVTEIFQCVLPNTGIVPFGNSVYWTTAGYAFYQDSIQYYPGDTVVYQGLATEPAQAGQVYVATAPVTNCNPTDCTGKWQPQDTYFTAPTIYPGDESQLPDPFIQSRQGVANTPAFRGICYAVWEGFPLANFGNRVPNLRAAVNFG